MEVLASGKSPMSQHQPVRVAVSWDQVVVSDIRDIKGIRLFAGLNEISLHVRKPPNSVASTGAFAGAGGALAESSPACPGPSPSVDHASSSQRMIHDSCTPRGNSLRPVLCQKELRQQPISATTARTGPHNRLGRLGASANGCALRPTASALTTAPHKAANSGS